MYDGSVLAGLVLLTKTNTVIRSSYLALQIPLTIIAEWEASRSCLDPLSERDKSEVSEKQSLPQCISCWNHFYVILPLHSLQSWTL